MILFQILNIIIRLISTSDINLTIGSSPNGTNQLTITIGGISSVASVTSASNATSTHNTLVTTLGTNQGRINGATNSAELEKMQLNYSSTFRSSSRKC